MSWRLSNNWLGIIRLFCSAWRGLGATVIYIFLLTEHNQDLWDMYSGRYGCHHSSHKLMLCFYPSLVSRSLATTASPERLTHSCTPSDLFRLQPCDTEWNKGSSSPLLEEGRFPSPVLRTYVPQNENLCKKKLDREVSLVEGQEGGKPKCDDIILQFLHVFELLQPAVPSAEHPVLCNVEQLHLPQSTTGLLSLPRRSKKWQYCLFLLLTALPRS